MSYCYDSGPVRTFLSDDGRWAETRGQALARCADVLNIPFKKAIKLVKVRRSPDRATRKVWL